MTNFLHFDSKHFIFQNCLSRFYFWMFVKTYSLLINVFYVLFIYEMLFANMKLLIVFVSSFELTETLHNNSISVLFYFTADSFVVYGVQASWLILTIEKCGFQILQILWFVVLISETYPNRTPVAIRIFLMNFSHYVLMYYSTKKF